MDAISVYENLVNMVDELETIYMKTESFPVLQAMARVFEGINWLEMYLDGADETPPPAKKDRHLKAVKEKKDGGKT